MHSHRFRAILRGTGTVGFAPCTIQECTGEVFYKPHWRLA